MKTLVFDLETSRNTVTFKTFDLIKKDFFRIPHDAIKQERNILTASWIWKGDKKPQSIAINPKKPRDDKHIVKTLFELFAEADEIVAHYGDKFDARYVRGRGLIHGFDSPPPVKQIDTYKIAKSRFYLNSYRLDYIGKVLGIGGKIKTNESLWEGCENGDPKSINNMLKYNEQDVVLLDRVHDRLMPYAATTYILMKDKQCPYCGGFLLQSRGKSRNRNQWFRRFQCKSCGRWGRMKDG